MIELTQLFPIGIGSWGLGGFVERDPSMDRRKQLDAVSFMLQQGMNYLEANVWYSRGASAEILSEGIERSAARREDIFICQAIYLKDSELSNLESEIERGLCILKTDYVDSVQLTQNIFLRYEFDEVCEAVERVLSKGKARYASITNENLPLLRKYHDRFGEKLVTHEVCYNFEIRINESQGIIDYAARNGIRTVVYQPLRRNRTALKNWPLLVELAAKYGVSQNQLLLRWIIAKGFLPLVKSESKAHVMENLAAIKLSIDKADLEAMDKFSPLGIVWPKIDWVGNGDGVTIDQLSNVFDRL